VKSSLRSRKPYPGQTEEKRKMAKVLIEKFIGAQRETSLSVPFFVLGIAKTLLPESALSSLA
jgi:hypothetical protein